MRVKDVILRLEHGGIPNAKQEALWLMSHALGLNSAAIYARDVLTNDEAMKVDALISRRFSGEPLQYILGYADFYGRDFLTGPGVLIPRHDTETLIDGVGKCFAHDDAFRFLDWGTGTGCIAATILLEFPKSSGFMLDVNPEALKYACDNLERYGLNDRAAAGDELVAGNFDLIVSNPPYIPSGEIAGLMREVRDFEPLSALDGGEDGMMFYREIMELSTRVLKPEGYIIFEAGNVRQYEALRNCDGDFEFEGSVDDFGGFHRCVILRRRA